MKAGTTRVDITPPGHIPYLGFYPRHEFAKGTHDRLMARALVLQQGATLSAILSIDSIGFSRKLLGPERDFTTELRERITDLCGIPAEHIIVATSHAHSTPETINFKPLHQLPGGLQWLEELIDVLARCVAEAFDRLRPAQLKLGQGQCAQVSWNRHSRDAVGLELGGRMAERPAVQLRPIDPTVDVLLIEYEEGPADVMMRFTCHPVIVQVQPLWSADFPGVACAVVERATGGNCLFLQGAAGDINPVSWRADFNEVERIGNCLGAEAWKVVEELRTPPQFVETGQSPVLEGTLRCASSTIEVPSRALTDAEEWERVWREATDQMEHGATVEAREAGQQKVREIFSKIDRIRMGDAPFRAEIQTLSIGDFALVALPGEPFVEYGFDIRDASSFPNTWVVGYCNDYLGYFSRDWAWEEELYPTRLGPWCLVSAAGGQLIMDEASRLLEEEYAEDKTKIK